MRIGVPRSLRGRLLAATLALVAVGLIVAAVVTYGFLNNFLMDRLDAQLASASNGVLHQLQEGSGGGPQFPGPDGEALVPPGTWTAILDRGGTVVTSGWEPSTYSGPRPTIPKGLPGSTGGASTGSQIVTIPGPTDGAADAYRMYAAAVRTAQQNPFGTLIIAAPLTEVTDTLHRLLLVEVLVSAGVLLVVGLLALWLVRLGLRPLVSMGETAGAIAAGDLSQRVEPAEEGTEVGRLGLSLNAMLAQIEEAFDERRASEDRLRRFVADASHELRTPLTSIRGYSELFRHGASDHPDDLAKAMERIEAEAQRMGVLVEDLLLLARMDQGLPLARDRVDLSTLAARAIEDARAADPEHAVDLTGEAPVFVMGDEARLKQILDNLLANTRRHTPPGTPAHVTVASNGAATVVVTDEGPGIDPEVGVRVFERFYRVDSSRSREKGGAGLGLAIASEIALAHGGALDLMPSDGGATFRLTLPLATDAPPRSGADGSSEASVVSGLSGNREVGPRVPQASPGTIGHVDGPGRRKRDV
jgi:two-component system OmpR family sensor kinase